MNAKTLTLIAAALSLVLLGGCHASCKDFCNDSAACSKKVSPSTRPATAAEFDECVSSCKSALDTLPCKNTAAVFDCLDSVVAKCDQATEEADLAKCPKCQK